MKSAKKPQRGRRNRSRRKKRGRILKIFIILLLAAGAYYGYSKLSKPYTVALDAGHGGEDTGALGVIQEVELTEQTTKALEAMLKADGRFRVVLSRKYGESKDITSRNHTLKKKKPDILLSIHGNADDLGQGTGFECFPSPPGRENYGISFAFAGILGQEMAEAGSVLRGINGIRYGYYIPNEAGEYIKTIKEADDLTEYEYGTFGILEGMDCPAVLVEQCFVTNEGDVMAFAGEEGTKKAAAAYYKSICRYLGITPTI